MTHYSRTPKPSTADLEGALRREAPRARAAPARALRVRTLAALNEAARLARPGASRLMFRWLVGAGMATGLAAAAVALAFVLNDAPNQGRIAPDSAGASLTKAIGRVRPPSPRPERQWRLEEPLQREARLLAQDARAAFASFQQGLPGALRDDVTNLTGLSR